MERLLPQTIEWLSPEHVAILNSLPETRQVEMVFELWDLAWGTIESNVRSEHPDWNAERVQAEVRSRMITREAA